MPAGRRRPAASANPKNMYSGLMTPDMISILAVGVTLAGLILNGQRQIRADQRELQRGMAQLRAEFTDLRREVSGLDARLSRLEGVVSTALFNRPPLVESAEHGD